MTYPTMAQDVPRPEHPRPDMLRTEWISLNGPWQFAESDDDTAHPTDFPETINVPFCRESLLSGLQHKGFVKNVWYKRTFTKPVSWKSPRMILHIGASDWRTTVWVNGQEVGNHTGGQAPLDCDIQEAVHQGENTIVVHAFDDTRSGLQALGKQCPQLDSYGCLYTRTTGIWQSVWLEGVGEQWIRSIHAVADSSGHLSLAAQLAIGSEPLALRAELWWGKKKVGAKEVEVRSWQPSLDMHVPHPKLWGPGEPNLYDLKLSLIKGGKVVDSVKSYVGFRTIKIEGPAVLINGKRVFQRLVLDQGFYPDGVWTAPSDAALKHDIQMSLAAGFNGARLHQKVFEPRFLYWADHLGYMVWGEFPNWGLNYNDKRIQKPMMDEWQEVVERDRNHPSIVGWCPFNETPGEAVWLQNPTVALTHKLDSTRPVIDSSGYAHGLPTPQVLDAHDYDQNPTTFKQRWDAAIGTGNDLPARYSGGGVKKGIPFMVSEYGGIGWETTGGWGYGDSPKTLEQYYARFKGLSDALLDNPNMFGFCFTQLTDVEQEHNGIYKYDRTPKFDVARLHKILSRPAAIEIRGPTVRASTVAWDVLVGSARDKDANAWHSTTNNPGKGWNEPAFADASWYVSPGGFGQKEGWEESSKTPWTEKDIWLRQEFDATSTSVKHGLLVIHYDNAAEVYLNGQVLWHSAQGAWNDDYQGMDVTQTLRSALKKGKNVIAVHCHQDTGGQFIDLALLRR